MTNIKISNYSIPFFQPTWKVDPPIEADRGSRFSYQLEILLPHRLHRQESQLCFDQLQLSKNVSELKEI